MEFSTKNLGSSSTYIANITEFRGLDTHNPPNNVQLNRAIKMQNLLMENGKLKKRKSFKEIRQFDEDVKNVFFLQNFVIFHIKDKFIICNDLLGQQIKEIEIGIDSPVSQAFYNNERLYILCGKYMVAYIEGEKMYIENVFDHKDTYIPTVITGSSAGVGGNPSIIGSPLDDVNMLSRRAIEEFRPLTNQELSPIITNGSLTGQINFKLLNTPAVLENIYIIYGGERYLFASYKTADDVDDYYWEVDETSLPNGIKAFVNGNTIRFEAESVIENGNMFYDTIKFEYTLDSKLNVTSADSLNECSFGITYGYNKDYSTLFLSGNPNQKNKDYWSYSDGTMGDFTYFPDLNYAVFGGEHKAIKGYGLLTDGTMAVIKEEGEQISCYYRSYNLTEVNGNYKMTFPITFGNISEGCINTSSVKNVGEELLFLNKGGIFGVETNPSVNTLERNTKNRCKLIDTTINEYKDYLEASEAFVFERLYYLSLKDEEGTVIVLDTRYPFTEEETNNKQFECFVLKGIYAKKFFTLNDELYYISINNAICKFTDGFIDIRYKTLSAGEITDVGVDNEITITPTSISDDEKIDYNAVINLDEIRCIINEEIVYDEELKIYKFVRPLNKEEVDVLTNNTIGYIKNGENLIVSGVDLIVNLIEENSYEVAININQGETVDEGTNFELYISKTEEEGFPITDVYAKVQAVEFEEVLTVALSEYITIRNYDNSIAHYCFRDGNYIELTEEPTFNIIKIDMPTLNLSLFENFISGATIVLKKPIEAFFQTPHIKLGEATALTNIKQLLIVPEQIANNKIDFGYKTLKKNKNYEDKLMLFDFDLNNLDFDRVDFNSYTFSSSYSKRCNIRNANYISFIFYNKDNSDMSINSIYITYTSNKLIKGVK